MKSSRKRLGKSRFFKATESPNGENEGIKYFFTPRCVNLLLSFATGAAAPTFSACPLLTSLHSWPCLHSQRLVQPQCLRHLVTPLEPLAAVSPSAFSLAFFQPSTVSPSPERFERARVWKNGNAKAANVCRQCREKQIQATSRNTRRACGPLKTPSLQSKETKGLGERDGEGGLASTGGERTNPCGCKNVQPNRS